MREWRDAVRQRLYRGGMDPGQESSVVEELAQHLEDRYAELRSRGEAEHEARRIALEEIEDVEALVAASRLRRSSAGPGRSQGPRRWGESLVEDVRVALRTLLRTPGFTMLAVLVLAIGIGANIAIFSVVDAVLLNPLGVSDADRLVSIRGGSAPGSDLPPEFGLGPEFFLEYRENASTLEDVGFYQTGQASVRSGDHVERLYLAMAAPSMFSTLGAAPVIGRLPTEQDEKGTVALISYRLWTTWFARDSTVIGRALDAGGGLRTVIGVMPPGFRFPEEQTAVWISDVLIDPPRPGMFWGYRLIGRLAPGADLQSVAAELSKLVRRLPERFGGDAEFARLIEQHRPIVRSLEEELVGDVERPLWIIQGAVGLVLLIACANVANLLIVRAESRRHDLAVRRALGAGRADLIRSQMTEAFVLVTAAAGAGVLLARLGTSLLVRAAPEGIMASVRVDRTALAFGALIAVVTECASGLYPALRFSNPEIGVRLRERHSANWGSAKLMRSALVAVQTAAALVLMVGSGLLFQSFRALYHVDPGFETANVFTFQTAPDASDHGLTDGQAIARFHYDFMDRLAAIAGVESVGLVATLPLDEGAASARVQTRRSGDPGALVRLTVAGGDYFQTMGIDLLSGSVFGRDGSPGAEPRAVVSKSAAELLWPGENPLGQSLTLPRAGRETDWLTVGGVVEDVMLTDFREGRPEPLIYLPLPGPTPQSWDVMTPTTPAYVVKTDRAETIAPEIRALIREVAPDAPMYRIFTMDELAARSMARLSFTLLALAIGSVLSLVMGAIGIYGTLAFVVSQRTKEIGIRIALGARRSDVQRMVVGQGMKVVAIAVALGLAAALAGRRLLASLLFGVSPNDLGTYGVVVALLVGVALLACWIPARRASRFDPIVALRAD